MQMATDRSFQYNNTLAARREYSFGVVLNMYAIQHYEINFHIPQQVCKSAG